MIEYGKGNTERLRLSEVRIERQFKARICDGMGCISAHGMQGSSDYFSKTVNHVLHVLQQHGSW